jgi:predicted transcriptional regulator
MLLLQGISSYKDFREGLQLLHSDAKWLSDAIISESLYQTKAKHHDVIRVEARTGIIGSVHKILNQLGRIKSGAKGAMLASDIVEKIDDVQDELSKLMENICDLNDRNLVAQECKYLVQELPDIPVPPKDKTNSDHAINEYRRKKSSLSSSVDIHLFIEK